MNQVRLRSRSTVLVMGSLGGLEAADSLIPPRESHEVEVWVGLGPAVTKASCAP
ncbi:MAG: hypothetical protein VCC20_10285 [Myxococcota bacterium]